MLNVSFSKIKNEMGTCWHISNQGWRRSQCTEIKEIKGIETRSQNKISFACVENLKSVNCFVGCPFSFLVVSTQAQHFEVGESPNYHFLFAYTLCDI